MKSCPNCGSTKFIVQESIISTAELNDEGELDCSSAGNEIDSIICGECDEDVHQAILDCHVQINF